MNEGLSTNQVKRAGRTLKHFAMGRDVTFEEADAALDVLIAFRAAHSYPLVKANNGLRSMVKTTGCEVEVSQRLKRIPTIIDKLVREPTLPLSSMQDIGGVRSVLNSVDEVRRVERRIRDNWRVVAASDYITTPRSSGYRGVHVVVDHSGRRIEIQLRTRVMHDWAITVERLQARTRNHLKSDGDHPVQRLLAVIAEAMAIEEAGGTVPPALLSSMATMRLEAAPYLQV